MPGPAVCTTRIDPLTIRATDSSSWPRRSSSAGRAPRIDRRGGAEEHPEEIHRVDSCAVREKVVRRVDVRPRLRSHGHVEHVVPVSVDRGRRAELGTGSPGYTLCLGVDRMGEVDDPSYFEGHAGGSFDAAGEVELSCAVSPSCRFTFEPKARLKTR